MIDAKKNKRVVPCYVIERTGDQAVVACPGGKILSEAGEWILAKEAASSGETRAFTVDGVEVSFHRVTVDAIVTERPRGPIEEWMTPAGQVQEPALRLVQKVHYSSDAVGVPTDSELEQKDVAKLALG